MEDPASMHRYATPEISVQALRERTDEITSSDITMDSPDDSKLHAFLCSYDF